MQPQRDHSETQRYALKDPRIYSPQFVTVLTSTQKLVEKTVRKHAGMSSTDYCILQELAYQGEPMELSSFSEFLLLKPNAVSVAATRLESAGLVVKTVCENDLRKCEVAITDQGTQKAQSVSRAIYENLQEATWGSQEDERVVWGMLIAAKVFFPERPSLAEASKSNEAYVVPAWIVALNYLNRMWATVVARAAHLSLSEYRILEVLAEKDEGTYPLDLARHLNLTTSALSGFTKSLREVGYITMQRSDGDKRFSRAMITEAGREAERSAHRAIAEATEKHSASLTDDEAAKMRNWYLSMYEVLTNERSSL